MIGREAVFNGGKPDDCIAIETLTDGVYILASKHSGLSYPDMAGVVLPRDEARRMAYMILEETA